ncbi:unnamed protein product [Arabidopsis halleri]
MIYSLEWPLLNLHRSCLESVCSSTYFSFFESCETRVEWISVWSKSRTRISEIF